MAVAAPFSRGHTAQLPLASVMTAHDGQFVRGAAARVDAAAHTVVLTTGAEIDYDVLVLALGASAVPAFAQALTFGAHPTALNGILADLEEGWSRSIAFVVPRGCTWTLPLYELALMTAREAWTMGADRLEIVLVTPEDRPLAIFGGPASDTVAELLDGAGIEFVGSAYTSVQRGRLIVDPGGRRIDVDRVVSLPRLEGLHIPGVPRDAEGFAPVDDHGRVAGVEGIYAAGDGTAFPIKQGGLATQQADAVAETIAAAAGAPIEPQPFRPVLRGMLLTGGDNRFMRSAVAGGAGEPEVATHALWWPPTKVAGRYLAPFLFDRDDLDAVERIRGDHLAVEADLGRRVLSSAT